MLSNAVICEGKYARASAIYMYREVLPTLRRIVGAEHPYTLVSSMNLALVLDDLGKHGEAETIHREVLAVRRRVLGPEHQDTLTCCANWAVTLSSSGNHIDAEALLREVVAVQRRVLGLEHQDTHSSSMNLANSLSRIDAEQIYGEVSGCSGPRTGSTNWRRSTSASMCLHK